MILYLKALSKGYNHRDFLCSVASVELACDVLNHLLFQGEILLEATIIEGDQQIKLPLEVFDGESFQTPLQDLEQQWKQVLDEPTHLSSLTDETLVLMNRWTLAQQQRINSHQLMIRSMHTLIESTTEGMSEETRRSRLISRYEAVIKQHRKALAHLYEQQISSFGWVKPVA